ERRIGRRVMLLSGQLAREADAGRGLLPQSASHEIENLQAEQRQIDERIRGSSPGFAALVRREPLTLSAIQESVLDDDTVLLQFALGDKCSYAWLIGKNDRHSFQLASQIGRAHV